ncbi:unnamed protein product, partial [Laminaria digitata]
RSWLSLSIAEWMDARLLPSGEGGRGSKRPEGETLGSSQKDGGTSEANDGCSSIGDRGRGDDVAESGGRGSGSEGGRNGDDHGREDR